LARKIDDPPSSKGRLRGGVRRAETRTQSCNNSLHRKIVASVRENRHEYQHGHSVEEKLTREFNHRLRNIFSAVLTIVKRSAVHYPQAAEYRRALEWRLRALSAATAFIDHAESDSVNIPELIRLELAPFQEGDNVFASGPDVSIRKTAAQDLAILLHELTTNAVKHGALSDEKGKLSVTWHLLIDEVGNSSLCLDWIEQGGPKTEPPQDSGFGMAVVRESGSLLGGTASIEFAPEGLRYRLNIPAARLLG
jgi:two-component sensor histidine kinase